MKIYAAFESHSKSHVMKDLCEYGGFDFLWDEPEIYTREDLKKSYFDEYKGEKKDQSP